MKTPRSKDTYRGARRNAAKGQIWQPIDHKGREPKVYYLNAPPVRPNKRDRSQD